MESRVGAAVSPATKKLTDRSINHSSQNQPKHSTPIKDYMRPIFTPLSHTKSKLPKSKSDFILRDHNMLSKDSSTLSSLQTSSMKKSRRHGNSDRRTPESALSAVRTQLASSLAHCDDLTDSVLSTGMPSEFQLKLTTEFENTTILKQRQELQLLVGELKDRDRELNEMVATHQRQMASWEKDRQKIANLEDNLERIQNEVQNRNHEYRGVVAKLRTVESEELNKSTALNNTQEQLAAVTEQHSHTSTQLMELEGSKRTLNSTIRDLSSTVGNLEAREEELITVLKLKDRDLSETSSHIAELNAKLKMLDGHLQDGRDAQITLKRKGSAWKNKCEESAREAERLKREILRYESACDDYKLEIHKLKQDLSTTKKEVVLANEREKRKDQLLQLQKSKQERTDSELSNLRRLYERQQMDLSLLHSNLESTKELLKKTTHGRSPDSSLLSSLSLSEPSFSPAPRSHRTISPPRHIPYRSTSPGSILRRHRSKSPGTSAAQVYDDHSSSGTRTRTKSPRSYIDRTRSRSPSLEDPPVSRDESRSSRYDGYPSPYHSYSSYRYYASRAFDGTDGRRETFENENKSKKNEEEKTEDKTETKIEEIRVEDSVPAKAEPELATVGETPQCVTREDDSESQGSSEGHGKCSTQVEEEPVIDEAGPTSLQPTEISEAAVREGQSEVDRLFETQSNEQDDFEDISVELSSQTSNAKGVDESSARETDSPATKLHKLLVESCDMVQDLERSTASSIVRDDDSQVMPERDIPSAAGQLDVGSASDTSC